MPCELSLKTFLRFSIPLVFATYALAFLQSTCRQFSPCPHYLTNHAPSNKMFLKVCCNRKAISLKSSTFIQNDGDDSKTERLPLIRIFNRERDYLFTTQRNVRSFEWSTEELDELFEGLVSLFQDPTDTLELNVIILVERAPKEGSKIGPQSRLYDVSENHVWLMKIKSA